MEKLFFNSFLAIMRKLQPYISADAYRNIAVLFLSKRRKQNSHLCYIRQHYQWMHCVRSIIEFTVVRLSDFFYFCVYSISANFQGFIILCCI